MRLFCHWLVFAESDIKAKPRRYIRRVHFAKYTLEIKIWKLFVIAFWKYIPSPWSKIKCRPCCRSLFSILSQRLSFQTFDQSNVQAQDKKRQFCTTPPNISSVGILVGWPFKTSNVLGSIPTVAVPNPVHPPLLIFLTWLIFCTKNKWTFTSKIYVLGFCWDDDWKSESVV